MSAIMHSTIIYTIVGGSLVVLWPFYCLIFLVLRWFFSLCSFWIAKYLSTPLLSRLIRGDSAITRMHLLLLFLFVTGNIVAVLSEGLTLDGIRTRTGHLALANMIPVALLGRPSVFVDFCGIPYDERALLHRWIGTMVFIHSVTHSAIAFQKGSQAPSAYIVSVFDILFLWSPLLLVAVQPLLEFSSTSYSPSSTPLSPSSTSIP
ncbi:hypothetical protein FPQ18DRAFT_327910 [Pyronema domesticum]|nr:hypothetical protein FPQ18DRAFT_327910 [Pyronema domesticum]